MVAAPPQDSTMGARAAGGEAGEASAPARAAGRHDEFYFQDEMTVFQVENRLFRVHRHFLADNSDIFSSMFSLPPAPPTVGAPAGPCVEGISDANPIILSGVTELEFETLLRYSYNGMHDDFALPQPCWIALLSIAHRYEFLKVRERAIREIYGPLQKLGPAELSQQDHDHRLLISVAEKYDVPPRNMLPSLTALVAREEQLTEIEVESFTAFTVSRLARAREDFLRKAMDHVSTQNMRSKLNYFMQQKGQVAKTIVCDIWPVQNDSPRPANPLSMTSEPGSFWAVPS